MSIRIWVSPPVKVANENAYYPKAEDYCNGGSVNWAPVNADGTPAATWWVTAGRSSDWAAALADSQLIDVFAGDLPASVNTVADFKALLRTRTVGDIAQARRQQITTNLNNLGVVTSDFTLTTPLWKVFQRLISTLSEKDHNFGGGFDF